MKDRTTINFTPATAKDFKKAYEKAKKDGVDQFTWQGHEFVLGYAKYLIQFLETKMGGMND